MNDPLNPGIVRPGDDLKAESGNAETLKDDHRPFWVRLFTSLRPSVSSGTSKRTGEKYEEFEVKGHIDF